MPKLYKARTVAWGRLRSGKASLTCSVQASSGLRRGMGGPSVNTVVPITSCPRGENLMPRQLLTSYRVRKTPPSEGGSRALAGELFATEAARRKLAGIVIDGACRDTLQLATLQLPVYASRVCPAAGTAQRLGATQQAVSCGGVTVAPGDVVIGDRDGIVVVSEPEMLALLPRAEEVQRTEAAVLQRLEQGEGQLDMLNLAEHCDALEQGRPSKLRFQV